MVTSIYEAANIHSILNCRDKRKDRTPLWFMYVTVAVQLLMVNDTYSKKKNTDY